MRVILLSVLGLLAALSVSRADDCRRVRSVYSSYVAPAAYVAPSYANIVLVPKAIEVEVYRPHYYSMDTYYQQSLLADAIVGRLLQRQPNVAPGPGRMPAVPAGAEPAAAPAGPVPVGSFQNAELSAALKNTCYKCHDGKTQSALLGADDKLLDLPRVKLLDLYYRVNTGNMPKFAPPLEDKYMATIDAWVKASK